MCPCITEPGHPDCGVWGGVGGGGGGGGGDGIVGIGARIG